MGQRTQILVVRENNNGEKKARFYHHQWGYGRNMYHAVMDAVLNDYNKNVWNEGYDFLESKTFSTFNGKLSDETPMTMNEVMSELAKHYCMEWFKDEVHKSIEEKGYYSNRNAGFYFDCDTELTKALNEVDLSNFETVKEVFKYGDNNNGGLVIYIKEAEERYDTSTFKIGFLLGYEDQTRNKKAFAEWLTPAEYGKLNGASDLSDKDFIKMFEAFCKYYEIQYFTND